MRFRRSFPRPLSLWAGLLALAAIQAAAAESAPYRLGKYYWPTENPAFVRGEPDDAVLQPTVSGHLESATFGCVRNDGSRFHEGVDLKATRRDRRGEATDSIFAFDYGVVRHVNRRPGSSSFGNYVVIEHPGIASGVVSVYAHLAEVPDGIQPGVEVAGGQRIATMGRTSSATRIPRGRAHLHFEVGFWLGPDFQAWFDRQGFGSPNEHGAYNGMNIVGLDVWRLLRDLRSGAVRDVWEFAQGEPVAVVAVVRGGALPEMLKANPRLQRNISTPGDRAGWRALFTAYGAPIGFEALRAADIRAGARRIEVSAPQPGLLDAHSCSDLIRSGGAPGGKLGSLLGRMFPEG